MVLRVQDIEIGKYYRIRNTSGEYCDYYGWAKAIKIYKRGQYGNPSPNKSCVECEHTVNKNDKCGFIRYFSPYDLIDTKGK